VSVSPALKWFIATFFSLSLAWKLSIGAQSDGHPEERVIAFLTRQGFDAVVIQDTDYRGILAVNNSCRMRMIIVSGDGSDRDRMRSLVTTDESLVFVYQGKVYQEQPTLLTVSAELCTRQLRKIGVTNRHDAVFAVLAQRQCDVERLPWDQLQSLTSVDNGELPRSPPRKVLWLHFLQRAASRHAMTGSGRLPS
jgi:hypothetical protein